ncbi:unannotated protein [freshwater metagenome]|uniref:Unannotated protein n=1 Tax=freshwater metagenome TaxID=449393 RepID=A0A6J6PLB7_9ZZZZ
MRILERPCWIVLHQGHRLLRRAAGGQDACAHREPARPPLAQRFDVRSAVLGQDVAGEVVAPHEQGHLQLDLGARALRADHDVVGSAVLEPAGGDDPEILRRRTEPEIHRVEQVRTQIRQHAGALVTPLGIAHQAGRAIPVEHAAAMDAAQAARGDQLPHAHEVRLEAVVVGGVAEHALVARNGFELGQLLFVIGPQRLLDQHVLAVAEQVREQLYLGFVGCAYQGRVVIGQRHFLHRLVFGLRMHRIDRTDIVRPGKLPTLVPLYAESDYDHLHGWLLVLDALFDHVDLAPQVCRRDRYVGVHLALAGGCHGADDRGNGVRAGRELGEGGIGQQRISGAHCIDDAINEGVDHEERVQRFVVAVEAGEHAALAEFEDQRLALGRIIQCRGQRANAGILIAEREARLPLVRRNQVEALEIDDVPPATGDLAIRDLEDVFRNGRHQAGDRPPVEHAVPEVAEHDRIGLGAADVLGQASGNVVRDRAVIERVDLEQAIAAGHDRVLVRRRAGRVDDRMALHAAALEAGKHEVAQCVVPEHR